MSYFLFEGTISSNKVFSISGKEARHIIQSRRIKPGETIDVQDSQNLRYISKILKIEDDEIELLPVKKQKAYLQSNLEIHLFQALIKEKALDLIIQKATELGVSSITFFHSQFSQRLKSPETVNKKLTRWRRIALEACKQSGRLKPPAVGFLSDLRKSHQLLPDSSTETFSAICLTSFGDTVPMSGVQIDDNVINLLIGPEGGWEASDLDEINCQKVHLGPRTLRSETAAISAVGILQFLFGDLQEKAGG